MATNTTRWVSALWWRSTSSASLVLPAPPGPTRQSSLLVVKAVVTEAISDVRPTNDESGTGGAPDDGCGAASPCSSWASRRRTAADMPECPFSQRLTVT
jgi:hypothetical protein